MDFLDPKKKRAHEIRLFIGYFLVGIMLLITTTILVFQASGYDVDRKTGAVIQNGLLFLDAHPEAATIYLNGVEKGQTDARFVLPAGKYDVELKRDGYRTWKQQFDLEGSYIERLVHPFMFPTNLISKELTAVNGTPSVFTASPDRKWLLVQQPGSVTDFDLIDLNNKTNPIKRLVFPIDLTTPAEGAHSFELVEWSTNNRHVLLKHVFAGGFEYVVLDREVPAESYNVSQTFGTGFDQVRLLDKKFDRLYLYKTEGGILQSGDVKTKAVSPLLSKVLAFQPHGDDMLLYATEDTTQADRVLINLREKLSVYTLRDLPKGPTYLLDLARYEDDWYVAAGTSSDNKAYVYKNPLTDLKKTLPKKPVSTTVLRTEGAQYLAFSANARFISLQGGALFAVYDNENERLYQYDSGIAIPAGLKATWMDGHRMLANDGTKVVVFDYNGTNPQVLVDSLTTVVPAFDRDYNAMFTLKLLGDKTSLQRTEMRVVPL